MRVSVWICVATCALVLVVASANDANHILDHLGVRIQDKPLNSTVFWPVVSLEEEDQKGLPGMQYDGSMPEAPSKNFTGRRIGFVVSHCFEEIELTLPYEYFALYGATVEVLAPWWVPGQVVSCEFVRAKTWVARTRDFKQALDVEYDAVVVPGGVWSSTVVRNDGDALNLIKSQFKKGKLLATTCSGSTVLINADLAKGRFLTGSPSIAIDLANAGANYEDVPTVTDGNIVSGRSPGGKDNQLWIKAMTDFLSKN